MKISDVCNSRQNNYDFLRFLAAVMVIFSHAFPLSYGHEESEIFVVLTKGQLTLGRFSVIVFFVISGFLIAQSYDRTKSIIKFTKARALRILPGLAVAVLFTAFVIGRPIVTTLPLSDYFKNTGVYKYLANATLLSIPNRLPGVFTDNIFANAVNGSLWTLRFEIMCYIIIGVLGMLKLLKKFTVIPMFAATYVVFVIKPWETLLSNTAYRLAYLSLFFFAGTLIYLYRDKIKLNKYIAISAFVITIVSVPLMMLKAVLPLTLSYLVFYFAYHAKINLSNFAKHGDYSYGIYIYAFPVQQAVTHFVNSNNNLVNFIIALPITIILSILSWHLVEKKAMKLKNKQLTLFKGKEIKA